MVRPNQEGHVMATAVERRQQRRAELQGRVEIRGLDAAASSAEPLIGRTDNVSLAGVYAKVPVPFPWAEGSVVSCSVTLPREATRQFPFTRLSGTGRVVRVFPAREVAAGRTEATSQSAEVGVAIAFSSGVTALGTIGGY